MNIPQVTLIGLALLGAHLTAFWMGCVLMDMHFARKQGAYGIDWMRSLKRKLVLQLVLLPCFVGYAVHQIYKLP